MKKILKVLIIFLLIVPLSSCWDSENLEELLIVYGIGIDKSINSTDDYLFTIAFPTIIEEAPEDKYEISVEALSLSSAKQRLQYMVYRKITYGNTRVIVFGKEAAEDGIIKHVDAMLREPIFPGTTRFVVVDTTAHELMNMSPPVSLFVSTYLFQAIKQSNQATRVPFTTLRNFNYQYYTSGIEPILPYISFDGEEQSINVNSTAVFKGDHLIHVFSDQCSNNLMILRGEINTGFYSVNYIEGDKNLQLSLRLKGGKSKIKTELQNSKLMINHEVSLDVNLAEYTGAESVFDPDIINKFEAYLNQYLEGRFLETLQTLQDLESDNIGYGLHVRANHPNYFKTEDWDKQFGNAEINVKVDVSIHTVGIIH